MYAASCNPPRRAKKYSHPILPAPSEPSMHSAARVGVGKLGPSLSLTSAVVAGTAAATSPTAHPSNNANANASAHPHPQSHPHSQPPPQPAPAPTPTKKRGRKPGSGTLTRSARESQRKINHSKIEKARRSKINDALDALRELVPIPSVSVPVSVPVPPVPVEECEIEVSNTNEANSNVYAGRGTSRAFYRII